MADDAPRTALGPLPPLRPPPFFKPLSPSEAAEARGFGFGGAASAPKGKPGKRPNPFTPEMRAKAAETRKRNAAARKSGAGKTAKSGSGKTAKSGSGKAGKPMGLAASLLARLRGAKRGSREYMEAKKELRAARVKAGYKGKAPLRRRPLSARPSTSRGILQSPSRKTKPSPSRKPSASVERSPKAPLSAKQREDKAAREARKQSFVGQVETNYDRHRQVVRGITVVGVAVGSVKLNQKYPDGLTPLGLEASTCVALGTTAGALIAQHFGYKRVASSMMDVTIGAVTGTLASNVGSGKLPLVAKKP